MVESKKGGWLRVEVVKWEEREEGAVGEVSEQGRGCGEVTFTWNLTDERLMSGELVPPVPPRETGLSTQSPRFWGVRRGRGRSGLRVRM